MPCDDTLADLLRAEIKPALGCTGPVLMAFAVAVSRNAVGGTPLKAKILLDKDTYIKNCAVGIPGIEARGIPIAAALGLIAGDASAGMEVLRKVRAGDALKARDFLPRISVDIKWDFKGIGLYVESWVETDKGLGHSLIAKTHTNVVFIAVNGKLIQGAYPLDFAQAVDDSGDLIRKYAVKDLFDFASSRPLGDLAFLREAMAMNLALAEHGLKSGAGENFGNALLQIPFATPVQKAKSLAAAAADARMAGEALPAMSCATSGNVGITASLPLISMAGDLRLPEERLLRALAFSFLLTIQIKSYIGRYSAFCACAIAASIGVAGGMVMLLGGNARQSGDAIRSIIGSTLGVVCDGAKHGCALKLSTGAGAAIEAAYLAMAGTAIRANDGFVCAGVDETIRLMGRMAHEGEAAADEMMCRLIFERDTQERSVL
ncbi:MAG: L-serine ammonia-lyase, iron-sulfur-dependent, subunit alpha [Deltaproteobacteria bacterium]|jgi:L-cysteine desulfidase|nr:L-serine ammonia-lyase, iron-sulfur-dependent, subunit alpha [Deltaproteobacteria bacterium]